MSSFDSVHSLSWGASDDDDAGSNCSTATFKKRYVAPSPTTVLPLDFNLTPHYHHSAVNRAFNAKFSGYNPNSGFLETKPSSTNSTDTAWSIDTQATAPLAKRSAVALPGSDGAASTLTPAGDVMLYDNSSGRLHWVQPSGPRRAGEGVADQQQGILSIEAAAGGASLRVTLLAAGFVIGPSGSTVRQLARMTDTDIKSWTEPLTTSTVAAITAGFSSVRVFQVQGSDSAVLQASQLICAAVMRYKELCEGSCKGKTVGRLQTVGGIDFMYRPPPRKKMPGAATVSGAAPSRPGAQPLCKLSGSAQTAGALGPGMLPGLLHRGFHPSPPPPQLPAPQLAQRATLCKRQLQILQAATARSLAAPTYTVGAPLDPWHSTAADSCLREALALRLLPPLSPLPPLPGASNDILGWAPTAGQHAVLAADTAALLVRQRVNHRSFKGFSKQLCNAYGFSSMPASIYGA